MDLKTGLYALLGNGSLQQFDVYAATVIWDGQARVVEIDIVAYEIPR